MTYRRNHGQYPKTESTIDMSDWCPGIAIMANDGTGWRMAYRAAPDVSGKITGYSIRLAPDTTLLLAGPWIETDERGLVIIREGRGTRLEAVGSPMVAIERMVLPCIRERLPRLARDTASPPTLRALTGCDGRSVLAVTSAREIRSAKYPDMPETCCTF